MRGQLLVESLSIISALQTVEVVVLSAGFFPYQPALPIAKHVSASLLFLVAGRPKPPFALTKTADLVPEGYAGPGETTRSLLE